MITGSAMRRLENITGLEVKQISPTCYALYVTPSVALFSFVADEKKACEQLRQQNWARVSRLAFDKAEWKCQRCGRMRECQAHHVNTRAQWSREDGPLDVVENLECLCPECHGAIHRPAPSSFTTTEAAAQVVDDLKEIDQIIEMAEREDDAERAY